MALFYHHPRGASLSAVASLNDLDLGVDTNLLTTSVLSLDSVPHHHNMDSDTSFHVVDVVHLTHQVSKILSSSMIPMLLFCQLLLINHLMYYNCHGKSEIDFLLKKRSAVVSRSVM